MTIAWISAFGLALFAADPQGKQIRDRPIASLLEDLRQADGDRQIQAARELQQRGMAGERPAEAIAPLAGLLRHANPAVRRAAAAALSELVVGKKEVAPELPGMLAGHLNDSDEDMRLASAAALAGLGRSAVPDLLMLLQGSEDMQRTRAARVLGTMGSMGVEVPEAIGPLKQAARSPNAELRAAAAFALHWLED